LGDEWAIVSKVELIANGTTVLFSCAGSDLRPISRILKGGISPKVSVNLGDGVTANPVLDSTVVIPFLNPRSTRPFDTLLYTGEMSDLRLEVTFTADWTAINASASAWTTNPQIEIYTREQTLPLDPGSGAPMLPNFYRRMLKVPITISAANSAFRYQLNTGPIYRGFILNGLSSSNVEGTGNFTNFKVFSGPTTFMDIAETVLYSAGNWKARIPFEQVCRDNPNILNNTGGTASATFATILAAATYTQADLVAIQNALSELALINDQAYYQNHGDCSPTRVMGSWYWADMADDGYMTESLDTDSIGDTYLEFNTPGAANVNVFTQELLRINRGGTGNVSPSV
jgi:hypothetical protein